MSSDDLDDTQGIVAKVWTYIRSIERAGLEGSDELEVSSDEENSSDSFEEGSGDDGDDGSSGGGGDGDDGGKGGDGGSGDGRSEDRKSTRLNSSHITRSRMPSSA